MQVPGYSRDKNPKINQKGLNMQIILGKRTKNETFINYRD